MLKIQNILPAYGFSITIDVEPRKFSDEIENEVESLWQAEQKRCRGRKFNGRIVSALTASSEGIHGCIIDYRYLIAQRIRPELFNVLQVRPVAVSGLLECADGIIIGRRADTLTQDAGLWELVPSGGIDAEKIGEALEVDYFSQILAELYEETGITSDTVYSVRPFCLVDDSDSHVLDIGVVMECRLTSEEVLTIHRTAPTKEYDELRIVRRSGVNRFIQDEGIQLVGVSATLIQNSGLRQITNRKLQDE